MNSQFYFEYLCGGGRESLRLADVCVCADFLLDFLGGLLTNGPDLVVAVVVVHHVLHGQDDGGGGVGEGGHANLVKQKLLIRGLWFQ